MAKTKELLTRITDNEFGILQLLEKMRAMYPTDFALFFDDDMSTDSISKALDIVTEDTNIRDLAVAVVQMDMVQFPTYDDFELVMTYK